MRGQPKPRHYTCIDTILPPSKKETHTTQGQPSRKHTSCCARHPQPRHVFRGRLRACRLHPHLAGMHPTPNLADRTAICLSKHARAISTRLHTADVVVPSHIRDPGGEPGCLTSLTLGIPARRTRSCEHERAAGLSACCCCVCNQSRRLARQHYIPQPRQWCYGARSSKACSRRQQHCWRRDRLAAPQQQRRPERFCLVLSG